MNQATKRKGAFIAPFRLVIYIKITCEARGSGKHGRLFPISKQTLLKEAARQHYPGEEDSDWLSFAEIRECVIQ